MATALDDFAHVEKLVGHSNFTIWKFQIVMLFKAADVYDVITTTVEDAAGKDKDWVRKDAKAQRYIITTSHKATQAYVAQEESKWNIRVHKVCCDMGGEYNSGEFIDCRCEKRIMVDCAPVATPQLNGRAERLNRTLLEKTRALLFESGMKKKLWGEALHTATYLLNRSPSRRTPQYLQEYVMLTYQEAISGENKDIWLTDIQEEKSSLKKNKVFEFVQEANMKGKQNLLSSRRNVDNQRTIKMTKNDSVFKRPQHIDVRLKFICEQANEEGINLVYCSPECQLGDVFTKL
ncbi:hypothetical protein PR048_000966 [Dryococelus australis]|uniref:Integrase catalytic domain-containing protein n=1 Tax=Dryococelus australis TaxID=614101 RepID=A0ABQ9IHI5_9NEOP|nr:hypothetical protein PR048_000966 [Dryococelus australis]